MELKKHLVEHEVLDVKDLGFNDNRYANWAVRLAQSFRDDFVYDDFDRTDRLISGDVCPTGQTWFTTGVGGATTEIENGILKATSNSYCSLDYGKTITGIEGTFSFVPGTGTNDATISTLTILADKTQVGLSDMLHLIISPTGWVLQKVVGAGTFDEIGRGTHTLIMDGTPYHMGMEIDGNTVTILAADGSTTSITDTDISGMAVRYGIWQMFPYANGYVGRWHSVGMGRSIGRTLLANISGAPIAEVTQLKGSEISKRQTVNATFSGGAGWYRIATASIMATFTIAGRVKISAKIPAVTSEGIEFTCRAVLLTGTHEIVQVQRPQFLGQITYIRLSSDNDSPYGMGLDVYWANPATGTVRIDFEGFFQPVFFPVVGATDYTDISTTLAVSNTAPAINSSSAVLNPNLNADFLDGQHLSDLDTRFLNVTGDTMTGALSINTNSTTALVVEQDGVKDNVLVVDTTNGIVKMTQDPQIGGYTLTVPATGTAALLGTANTFSDLNTFNIAGYGKIASFGAAVSYEVGYVSYDGGTGQFRLYGSPYGALGLYSQSNNDIVLVPGTGKVSMSVTDTAANAEHTISETVARLTQTVSGNFNNYGLVADIGFGLNTGITNLSAQIAFIGGINVLGGHLGTQETIVGLQPTNTLISGAGGTITSIYGSLIYPVTYTGTVTTAITNVYGINIKTPTFGGGTLTNAYGIYLEDINTASTINYSIYTKAGDIRLMASATDKLGLWGHAPAVQPSAYTPSNVTTDRSYNADSTTVDELADILGTLINDLQSIGLLG